MARLLLLLFMFQVPVHYVSDANVIVYHPLNVRVSTARAYLSVLSKIYSDESEKLEVEARGKLRVRLCRNAYDFSDVTGMDSTLSPLWMNDKLYVIASRNLDDPGFRSALTAGVIHGMLEHIRSNGAPRWLIYAAAVYESGEYKECTAPPIESVRYFSDLNEKIQEISSGGSNADLCFCLGNTGKFFDIKFGAGSFLKLVREFRRETDFDAAVLKLFHVNRERLEREWRDFITEQVKGG